MTIASGLRSANQHFIVPTPDDLTTAHGVGIVHDLYLMAHSSQLQGNIGGNGTLQLYLLAAYPLESGSIQSFLRIHAEVDGVQQHLQVTLRLHEAAHYAERADCLAILAQEAGDNGVVSLLAGLQEVVLGGVQREVGCHGC